VILDSLGTGALAAIFAAAAAIVWAAGIRLSSTTDILSERYGLGEALGGVILLAIATNLPEIAITASAAWTGDVDIAVGNILGGIAIQTVVLALLDGFGMKQKAPLTYRAASLVLILEAALVIAVLTVAIMGTQLPPTLIVARVAPGGLLIALFWVAGLWLIARANKRLPWQDKGDAPDTQRTNKGATAKEGKSGVGTARAIAVFAIAAGLTLAAGIALEETGTLLAARLGMSGVVFGATLLAAATALPEVSTGLAAMKLRDFEMAVSDIFGGNAFLPVLFLPATMISGKAVLPRAGASDVYLAALGILLTCIYVAGLIFRPKRRLLGIGADSLAVVILYAVGIAGLIAIPGGG
jgi:cation:H+ antiporter